MGVMASLKPSRDRLATVSRPSKDNSQSTHARPFLLPALFFCGHFFCGHFFVGTFSVDTFCRLASSSLALAPRFFSVDTFLWALFLSTPFAAWRALPLL